jgi:hypothetical protein
MTPEQFVASARCDRCKQRYQGAADADGWVYHAAQRHVITVLCPRCQTPEEYADAALSDAILAHDGEHIQKVLEELVADGLVEKIIRPNGAVAYRAIKGRLS